MKMIVSMAGTAVGALSVIFSFVIINYDTGALEGNVTYGGDAYTGIQNAAAQTAVNVYYLNHILTFGFFAILFVAGLALLCHYVPILVNELNVSDIKSAIKTTADQANGSGAAPAEDFGVKDNKIVEIDTGSEMPEKDE